MDIELIAGFRTGADVRAARKALARAGLPRERVEVSPTRSAGSLNTRAPAAQSALHGAIMGAISGAILAVLLPIAPERAQWSLFHLALFGAILGAVVGAFVGAASALSFGQNETADEPESSTARGFVLRVRCDGPAQRQVVSEILHNAHAAMLARESRTRRTGTARAL